jgi:hypothetical protein
MQDTENTQKMQRRDFLRRAAGGALALTAGDLLLDRTPAAAAVTPFRMFCSTFLAASVIEINQAADGTVTQKVFAQFGTDSQGRVETTAGVVVGPNNNLFIFSPGSDQIFMVDLLTGAPKRTLSGPFIATSHNGAIGPDGLLYTVNAPSLNAAVGTSRPDSIERFDATTGDHVDTFANTNTNPPVRGPFGLIWGPDGDLYVASVLAYGFNPNDFPFRPDHIQRFDGRTGEFKGFVVRETHLTFTMAWHPTGRLLVPSHFFNEVYMYNASTGQLVDAFADCPYPIGTAYGPDGNLYVASFADQAHVDKLLANFSDIAGAEGAGSILRFNGMSGGKPEATLISGLPFAGFISFA